MSYHLSHGTAQHQACLGFAPVAAWRWPLGYRGRPSRWPRRGHRDVCRAGFAACSSIGGGSFDEKKRKPQKRGEVVSLGALALDLPSV